MNTCFYCEIEEVEEDRACGKCTKLLRAPYFGPRLVRGSLITKLRGTLPPEECEEQIEKFIRMMTSSGQSQ